ncbi:hypothetical protein HYALB_00001172 [Hymenoscyphus albidus]|uniref:Uncharacterized protein n=1 Tax=Hymenoscyphus albidus TaxID=595503 RepID=A0A9N9Q2K8_9HELO|nr:hypothetical protein HYALB_00001172 [Hymenoscyphus albidus]
MDVVAGWFVDAEVDDAEKFRDILRNAIVLIGVSVDSPPASPPEPMLCAYSALSHDYHHGNSVLCPLPLVYLILVAINESTACFSSSEEGEEEIWENSIRYTGTQQAVEHGPIIGFHGPAQEPEVDLIPPHLEPNRPIK